MPHQKPVPANVHIKSCVWPPAMRSGLALVQDGAHCRKPPRHLQPTAPPNLSDFWKDKTYMSQPFLFP